jgi:hypothetical protein
MQNTGTHPLPCEGSVTHRNMLFLLFAWPCLNYKVNNNKSRNSARNSVTTIHSSKRGIQQHELLA